MISASFVPDAPCVYAQGDAYGADSTWARPTGLAFWSRTLSTFGWHILGFDAPSREYLPRLDAAMNAYNNGDLRTLAYAQLPRSCQGLGKISKRPAPTSLPLGSALYELKVPGKMIDDCAAHDAAMPPERAPDLSLVVVMIPDGHRTWIGFGPRAHPPPGVRIPPELQLDFVTRMSGLAKGASPNLPAEADLDALRGPTASIGGFLTVAGVGGLARFLTMQEHARWDRSQLLGLKDGGRTRFPFAVETTTDIPGGVTIRARITAEALSAMVRAF